MQIITHQSYRFRHMDGENERFTHVTPSRDPQTVPDEIKQDPLFAWAKADGSLQEVLVTPPPAEEPKPEDSPAKPSKK